MYVLYARPLKNLRRLGVFEPTHPERPLLCLLLSGLASPEVLPPLLQHVAVEDNRA